VNKRLIAAAAALASIATSASAADLPAKKATPEPVGPPEWKGFYLGLDGGYDWSISNAIQQDYLETLPGAFATHAINGSLPTRSSVSRHGFIGGGQIGWNWSFGNYFLIGFETDIQGLVGDDGSRTVFGSGTSTSFFKGLDNLGTARARLGYLFNPSLLLYGTAGLAYGEGVLDAGYYGTWLGQGLTDLQSTTLIGYSVGAGAEWRFLPQWSIKAEYLYYNLGSLQTQGAQFNYKVAGVPAVSTAQSTARFDGSVVRLGLNYHFKWDDALKLIDLE